MAVNSEASMGWDGGCNVLHMFCTLVGAVDRSQGRQGCKY